MRFSVALCIMIMNSLGGAAAGSDMVAAPGEGIILVDQKGFVQRWVGGSRTPEWSVPINGIGEGARSIVADLVILPDHTILIVERIGHIIKMAGNGEILGAKLPMYEYILLDVTFSEMQGGLLEQDPVKLGRTSVAIVSDDGLSIYLAPDEWSLIRQVKLDYLWNDATFGAVFVAESMAYHFSDGLVINKAVDISKGNIIGSWVSGENPHETALALCNDVLVVGSQEGVVAFIPTKGEASDFRYRQVGETDRELRAILDAGCLGADLAYTVSIEAGNGQLQLWDLETMAAVDVVDGANDGHFGMALSAVAGKDNEQLLSLGDGDARLWSVLDNKLVLRATHFFETGERLSAMSVHEGFLLWDGATVWKLGKDGGDPTWYAGALQ